MKTIILAMLLSVAPPHDLPQADVERLLEISSDLRARGFEQQADDVYAAATSRAFYRDDHPDELTISRAELDRLGDIICGPEGATDWTSEGPTCERAGWSQAEGRYVTPCDRGSDYRCEGSRKQSKSNQGDLQ